MDIKNTFSKEKIILYVIVLMQVYALTFYTQFVKMYVEQKQVF